MEEDEWMCRKRKGEREREREKRRAYDVRIYKLLQRREKIANREG